MTATDLAVEAATRAWLDRLPAAERLAAHAHTDARLIAWLGAGVAVALTAWLVARSGGLGALRRRLERQRPRPWLASATLAFVFALALGLVTGVYGAATAAWEDQILGRPPELGARVGRALAGLPSVAIVAALAATLLMALARRRPRTWPWIAGLVIVLACLGFGWGPYAFGGAGYLAPAPPGVMRRGLLQLAADASLPVRQIYLARDPGFDADVTGGFGRATVIVGRPVLGWPPAEARAYVGHLIGHYVHGDIFAIYLAFGLTGLAGLLACNAVGAPLARALGARTVRTAADPEALPAAAIVLVVALGVGTLATNGYVRWANVRADAYSLDHAREPDGLAAAILREWDHEAVDPGPLPAAVFYSHPPLAQRLRQAMAWKAAHGGSSD